MPSKTVNQQALTLRFKQHKTTVLLLVQQSQSFESIKEDLLDSIKATGIKDINGLALPSDPENIMLGVPVDKLDPSKGWMNLEIPEVEDGDTKGKGVKKGSLLNQNPLGAGLKDGAMLAFKFKKAEAGVGHDDVEMDDDWNVIIPSYDDE